ncbi:MAG: non-ribosomal peptide synthase [Anabaena sp. LE011-02]|nr:MAG: non-ribosomal peptide synthase [Anabaena sp. LE011-02]
MNAAEILAKLTQQGVLFWSENSKLNIRSPKGVITPEIQIEIATYKEDILALIQEMNVTNNYAHEPLIQGISLQTIGKLIGGFSGESPTGYQAPIINPQFMAENLKVTFRPLPDNYHHQVIVRFRQQLIFYLQKHGVKVIPWKEATTELKHTIKIPIINWQKSLKMQSVRADIDAVIDVERPNSWLRKLGIFIAEAWYKLSYTWLKEKQQMSVIEIAKLSSWAEDHAAKYVEDPTNTQVIILTDIDAEFVNPLTPYSEKIRIGINTLIKTFSEIVIGVSDEKFSILNMNLSDSKFAPNEIENFALKSLIPKVFVPITPLLISRFELGEYNPHLSNYAGKLVKLGQELASTGLFPAGFKLDEVIKRKSHRDIVNVIVNGRTGVSYGFVAYAEPPHYVGKPEITIDEWENLLPVVGFSNYELRQNEKGRRFIKLNIKAEDRFKQIPDIWLVSSRSGANKTDLNIDSDILRIGLQDKLHLQLPLGSNSKKTDIKPSYDIYVMLAISLAAALYTPELIANGAPIVHFHGYPSFDWFQENEYCVGMNNPSVPCGTYESGVFNFLGIADLGDQIINDVNLISLVEPDHGTNFIASDLEYLVNRLKAGCVTGQIELGGKNFPSLKNR